MEERSSQLFTQLKQLRKESLKKEKKTVIQILKRQHPEFKILKHQNPEFTILERSKIL